jgi:3-oxoacyl-(acyl-carrier-protein) synthase
VIAGQGGASAGHATDETDVLAEVLLAAGRTAMAEARVKPAELLGVVLPGSGTPAGDRAALIAARGLIGDAHVPLVAWKGATGHCGCGSDAAEAAFAALAVADGVLPGTVGFESADPGFTDLWIAAGPVRRAAPAVLLLSAGADTQAAALVLARA